MLFFIYWCMLLSRHCNGCVSRVLSIVDCFLLQECGQHRQPAATKLLKVYPGMESYWNSWHSTKDQWVGTKVWPSLPSLGQFWMTFLTPEFLQGQQSPVTEPDFSLWPTLPTFFYLPCAYKWGVGGTWWCSSRVFCLIFLRRCFLLDLDPNNLTKLARKLQGSFSLHLPSAGITGNVPLWAAFSWMLEIQTSPHVCTANLFTESLHTPINRHTVH